MGLHGHSAHSQEAGSEERARCGGRGGRSAAPSPGSTKKVIARLVIAPLPRRASLVDRSWLAGPWPLLLLQWSTVASVRTLLRSSTRSISIMSSPYSVRASSPRSPRSDRLDEDVGPAHPLLPTRPRLAPTGQIGAANTLGASLLPLATRSSRQQRPPLAARRRAEDRCLTCSTFPPRAQRPAHALPRSAEYRAFLEKDGKVISPFHDIPLFANEEKTVLNMVVEIPRWSNAKLEISKEEQFNPILQDTKKGKLRFVRNCFPHKGYIWNYGSVLLLALSLPSRSILVEPSS